jgi:hypothetical protein
MHVNDNYLCHKRTKTDNEINWTMEERPFECSIIRRIIFVVYNWNLISEKKWNWVIQVNIRINFIS